jgi:nicotinamide riboside kinase
MAKAVIVYGPQGTGKTLHAEALARAYGKTRIYDDYDPVRGLLGAFPDDALVLTHMPQVAEYQAQQHDAEVVHIEVALQYARAH